MYPDDLDVVEGALDKNVRNARDVRNVAMPHFQEAKQVVGFFQSMLNTGEACEGKAAVLVDVKELSGKGRCPGVGGIKSVHDGDARLVTPDLVDLRKQGVVDAEAAWECDWEDSEMRERSYTGDVTWAETAFAKPGDYAPYVADALNGIADEHPEMGLRNTVVLTPHG